MDEMKEQLRKKFTEPRAEIVRLKGCAALRTSDATDGCGEDVCSDYDPGCNEPDDGMV